MTAYDLSTPAPDRELVDPSSRSFWTQPNRSWLVGLDDDSMLSRALSMPGCAGRGSRSDSELPPFDPCTAGRKGSGLFQWVRLSQDSPPGWELHPHSYRVVRNRSPCD